MPVRRPTPNNLLTQASVDGPASAGSPTTLAVASLAALFILSLVDWGAAAVSGRLIFAGPILTAGVAAALLLGPLAALLAFHAFGLKNAWIASANDELRHIAARIGTAIFLLTLSAAWLTARPNDAGAAFAAIAMGVATAGSWLFLAAFMAAPLHDGPRKLTAIVAEAAALSVLLHAGDAVTAPWFAAYLWIILVPGFRYGAGWLMPAAAASAVGFAAVVATTMTWRDNWPISIGLLAVLVMLPAVVAPTLRRLAAGRLKAEEAGAAKAHLLATVNQTLKGPLDTISGLSELMRQTDLSRDQATMLDAIRSASRGLLGTVDDLLDFSKMEAGASIDTRAGFDLPALLAEVTDAVAPEAVRKGLTLGCQIDPLLPDIVEGHPIALRRLLVSLVSNSIRMANGGEIRLIAGYAADDGNGQAVRFQVRDTGGGRAFETAQAILDRASGADDRTVLATDADDLGFALACDLARLIGSTVAVGGETGIASRFTIELSLGRIVQYRQGRHSSARIGIYGLDETLAGILATRFGATFTPLGALAEHVRAVPQTYDVLIFDGRADPVAALAAASACGGRATRVAPATLVIANAGAMPHLREMAPAGVDTVLAWTEDADIIGRTLARLIDGGHARPAAMAPAPTPAPTPAPMPLASQPKAPAWVEAAPKVEVFPEHAPPERTAPVRRFRVLVADSNQTNRMVLERMLSRATHEVLLVGDGNAALTALEVGAIDAAILDIKLTELSGYHVAKLYRQMEIGGQRLPLIGLAADATSETDRLCREAGMDATLIKPVHPKDILALLDRLVRTPLPHREPISDPTMVVTPITVHPRFTREAAPVIDTEALGALAGLGEGFIQEVIETFFIDAEEILGVMGQAQSEHDLGNFQDQVLAMRSSAVNLGGSRLVQTLRDAGKIAADDLEPTGDELIAKIRSELETLRAELSAHLAQRRPAE